MAAETAADFHAENEKAAASGPSQFRIRPVLAANFRFV